MFVRIKCVGRDYRLKSTSIGAFNVDGQSASTSLWYITIKISGKDVKFSWKTESEMRAVEAYLDKLLDVRDI